MKTLNLADVSQYINENIDPQFHAKKIAKIQNLTLNEIIKRKNPYLASCYGIDNVPDKGTHLRLCGQRFWQFISGGNPTLYIDLIEPLGHLAKERKEEIDLLCSEKLNIFTASFVDQFCDAGIINWDKLIRFNSGSH